VLLGYGRAVRATRYATKFPLLVTRGPWRSKRWHSHLAYSSLRMDGRHFFDWMRSRITSYPQTLWPAG